MTLLSRLPDAVLDGSGQERRRKLLVHATAALLLGAFAALLLVSMPYESPTVDEPYHYTRGAAFWWARDTRLSFAHPPLANALGALPDRGRPLIDFDAQHPAWELENMGELARAMMAADYPAFRADLFRARTVMIALAVLFGLYLYGFCLERFGRLTALLALLLYVIHPTIIAHARLMTTDMPITIASFVTLGELLRYLDARRLRFLLTTGIALGAAMSTKYSAVFLLPVAGGAALLDALVARGRSADPPRRRLAVLALHAAIVAVLAVVVVNASYRFQRTNETVAEMLDEREPLTSIARPFHGRLLAADSPLARLPRWLRVPLPYPYIFGLTAVTSPNQTDRSSYFMGRRTSGSVAYFPVLLILKQPLVLLLLLALASRRLRRPRALSRDTILLGGAAALYLALAMMSHLNLGVRHVLPMLPVLVVLAALEGASILRERAARPWRFRIAVGLCALSTAGTLAAFPHYIGYFNAIALNDAIANRISIVGEDWGQDVGDAAQRIVREGLGPVAYASYGPASARELAFFGVESTPARCDSAPERATWVVLHASHVRRSDCYRWLGLPDRPPDARVNEHLYLYRYEPRGATGPP